MALFPNTKTTDIHVPQSPVTYRVGDIVRLKSGGPDMTVVGTGVKYDVKLCEWFTGTTLCQSAFPPDVLVMVDKPDSIV